MPFHNIGNFVHLLMGYRLAWLGGRLGGGKTSFSFRLAEYLALNHGFRYIFSNCNSVWNDNPQFAVLRPNERGIPQFLDAVFILDEGGLFMSNHAEAKNWTVYLRKINVIVIVASNSEPHRSLKALTVQRTLNMMKYGLPFWLYRWNLESMNVEESGAFLWRNPTEIFGVYDTDAFPAEADILGQFLKDKISEADAANEAAERDRETVVVGSSTVARTQSRSTSAGENSQTGARIRYESEEPDAPVTASPAVSRGRSLAETVDDLRGDIDYLAETASKVRRASVSLSKQRRSRR